MSEETEEDPVLEIKEWYYPDNIHKMIMNDLIRKKTVSVKDYPRTADHDYDPAFAAGIVLEEFLTDGYVIAETINGVKYYTRSAFFDLMMQEFRDREFIERAEKQKIWDERQELKEQGLLEDFE